MAHVETEQPGPKTHPPRNIARVFLPLTAAIAEFCPRRTITSISCLGPYLSLSGGPNLYEVEVGETLALEPQPDEVWGTITNQWQLTTAWMNRDLCEVVSQLVTDEANKYLSSTGYVAAPLRCKPMAKLCIINKDAPRWLPNHAVVAMHNHHRAGDQWILDGTFPQFGKSQSPRFEHWSTYFQDFVDAEQFPYNLLSAQETAALRAEINNSQYLSRAKQVTTQVLRSFPWDGSEMEQDAAVAAVLDRVWPELKLAGLT